MNLAVLIKQVPDTYSDRKLRPDDALLDRDAVDAVIDEIDTKALEVALQLVEAHQGEVTVLTMGPDRATEALRKALAMGAHRAVHVVDDSLAGSDAVQTSAVLAAALATLEPDLIISGNEASDGKGGVVPAMIAERLKLPLISSAGKVELVDGELHAERQLEDRQTRVVAPLPAVVSVTEKITEPRYPNFKGIMAAKSKPLKVLDATDVGIVGAAAGGGSSPTLVLSASERPAKSAGVKIVDDGTGAAQIAEYLISGELV